MSNRTPTILEIFPQPAELMALAPEDLAGVLVEIIPGVSQSAGFMIDNFLAQIYTIHGNGYPPRTQSEIALAFAEALSWMETQGIIVRNPNQPAAWYLLTKRGQHLKNRTDLEAFRKGRTLPVELLQPALAAKVHHLFLRGDHDTAVFQAFKEVEIAVRKAGNYANSVVGRELMQKAFHPDTGPLRDKALIPAERDSEMFLFSGAIGHAKNPSGHREVNLGREDAARLIVFASHLLGIVDQRSPK